MKISVKLDELHLKARSNRWMYYFAIFCRVSLAAGFIPSGLQKVMGERFTVLSVNHPMGNFLEAFHHTEYYYPFVGLMQVLAAILLLIPRTATLGAFIYFPIILNICILSLAVRFDGSLVTSPLMLCAVLYLLCWDYHKFKYIFPFNSSTSKTLVPSYKEMSKKIPFKFFASVGFIIALSLVHAIFMYEIMPRNMKSHCLQQCIGEKEEKCISFCDCIHEQGKPLKECLKGYKADN